MSRQLAQNLTSSLKSHAIISSRFLFTVFFFFFSESILYYCYSNCFLFSVLLPASITSSFSHCFLRHCLFRLLTFSLFHLFFQFFFFLIFSQTTSSQCVRFISGWLCWLAAAVAEWISANGALGAASQANKHCLLTSKATTCCYLVALLPAFLPTSSALFADFDCVWRLAFIYPLLFCSYILAKHCAHFYYYAAVNCNFVVGLFSCEMLVINFAFEWAERNFKRKPTPI